MNQPPEKLVFLAIWRRPIWLVIVAILCAGISYHTAYFMMVDEVLGATIESGTFLLGPHPDYSCGIRLPWSLMIWVERFFWPVHAFDRTIRPAKWSAVSKKLTPLDYAKGSIALHLKPEWKRHLPPDHSLEMELAIPDGPQLLPLLFPLVTPL